MSPLDAEHVALWWGPGILVLIIFGYGFLRLAHYWIEKTMEMKRQQSDGLFGIARQYIEQFLSTQKSQADALTRFAATVEQRESRASFEHQEILIALKTLHREVQILVRRLGEAVPPASPPPSFDGALPDRQPASEGSPA